MKLPARLSGVEIEASVGVEWFVNRLGGVEASVSFPTNKSKGER